MAETVEHKYVLTVPNVGLSSAKIAQLKKNFQNQIVESMGGPKALALLSPRPKIVIVVIVIGPKSW